METNQIAIIKRNNHGSSIIYKLGTFITMVIGGFVGYFSADTITSFCGASTSGSVFGKMAIGLGFTVKQSTPLSWVIGCTVAGCIVGLIAIKAVRTGVYRA